MEREQDKYGRDTYLAMGKDRETDKMTGRDPYLALDKDRETDRTGILIWP